MNKIYYILFLAFFSVSCAQQSGLSGGSRDLEAPVVDSTRTFPKNGSTYFNSNHIELTFDEFIQLSNPSQNIVVTPSLNTKPVYELKGKKLVIKFQEKLDSNTTYTVNFGNSISDITEGNKLLNYSYVFSTGAALDSLTLQGTVFDSYSKVTKDKVLVGLYKNSEDSVGLKQIPYYFTKTKENGSFVFNNIKEGKYTLLAIDDENNNLKYERFSESIAFLDSNVRVEYDTLNTAYNLSFFKEEKIDNWVTSKKYIHPGAIELRLTKKAEQTKITLLNTFFLDSLTERVFNNTDSIHFWITDFNSIETVHFISTIDNADGDTVSVKIKVPKTNSDTLLRFKTNTLANLAYFSPVTLTFTTPIKTVNKEQLVLMNEDSIHVPFEVTLKENEVKLIASFEESSEYELLINPNAFEDHYNTVNDSAHLFFSIVPAKLYGNIVLHYERSQEDNQHLVQLTQDNVVLEEFVVKEKLATIKFENLPAGSYQLKVINDKNNNGKWDTGDYLTRKQPELVQVFEDKIELKAGWDLDLTWKN